MSNNRPMEIQRRARQWVGRKVGIIAKLGRKRRGVIQSSNSHFDDGPLE